MHDYKYNAEYHSNLFCQQYKLNYRQSRYARRGMTRGLDQLHTYHSKEEAFKDVRYSMVSAGIIGLILSAFVSALLNRLAQMIVDYLWSNFPEAVSPNAPSTDQTITT